MSNKNVFKNILLASIALSISTFSFSYAEVTQVKKGNLITENVPETPKDIREKLIQYQNVRGAGFAGFNQDGSILITTRFGETNQVHLVANPMGYRKQLTFFDERVLGVTTRPKHNDFVFSRDVGGDEFYQYYVFDLATGNSKQITEPGTRNEALTFTKDGKYAAWVVSRSGSNAREIVLVDMDKPETKKVIFKGEGGWSVSDFSADGKKLLLGRYISVQSSKRAILDIDTGNLTELTKDIDVSYGGGQFSADGKKIYLTTDEKSDFSYGIELDVATGARKRLTPQTNWDVDGISITEDGSKLLYVTNEEGYTRGYVANSDGSGASEIKLPTGVAAGFEFKGNDKIGITISTTKTSSDAFVYDLNTRQLTQWTESEVGGLNTANFVEPKLIRYPTFDKIGKKQREIPAFIYEPKTPGKHPVIISIHGGPESQSRPSFAASYQYWANELDAIVVVPNVRGSNGYGKEYVGLDNGYKREDSVKDIGALIDYLGKQPNVDKDKIAVYGGSYGGYMVLASMTHYNDKLAGGVDIVGISNFVTFLKNTQGYRQDLRRVEYGDERDPKMHDFQQKIAPLNNAHKITKPMFVIQGANDPRVPRSEAEQIVAKIRENGGKVWYMLAMDEGHGFAKKSNRDAQREAETLFFKEIFGIK